MLERNAATELINTLVHLHAAIGAKNAQVPGHQHGHRSFFLLGATQSFSRLCISVIFLCLFLLCLLLPDQLLVCSVHQVYSYTSEKTHTHMHVFLKRSNASNVQSNPTTIPLECAFHGHCRRGSVSPSCEIEGPSYRRGHQTHRLCVSPSRYLP